MKFGAIIVGAGRGERLGSDIPKCLIRIDGIPLIILTAMPFERIEDLEAIILVVPSGAVEEIEVAVLSAGLSKITAVVPGGVRRQDSVKAGLDALSSGIDKVLVHDGARPLTSVNLVKDVIEMLRTEPAVIVAIPASDTLHRNDDGYAVQGQDRTGLWAAQTPQGFDRAVLNEAFRKAEEAQFSVTDEATMVREMSGIRARIVSGSTGNIKITRPEDLRFYQLQLQARVKQMKWKKL